jgi:hypothetical protein
MPPGYDSEIVAEDFHQMEARSGGGGAAIIVWVFGAFGMVGLVVVTKLTQLW